MQNDSKKQKSINFREIYNQIYILIIMVHFLIKFELI